jgi:hypothetical protein
MPPAEISIALIGRPAFSAPRRTAGISTSVKYAVVAKPCGTTPSATSPATEAITVFTAEIEIFGIGPWIGPGLKKGVISVIV